MDFLKIIFPKNRSSSKKYLLCSEKNEFVEDYNNKKNKICISPGNALKFAKLHDEQVMGLWE